MKKEEENPNNCERISKPVLIGDIIRKILAELRPDYYRKVIRTTCITKEPIGRMLKRFKLLNYGKAKQE